MIRYSTSIKYEASSLPCPLSVTEQLFFNKLIHTQKSGFKNTKLSYIITNLPNWWLLLLCC